MPGYHVDREIALLRPCNVLVRADPCKPGTVLIEAMDPGILVEVTGEPALIAIADEVTAKLGAAIVSLTPGANAEASSTSGRTHREWQTRW